MLIIFRLTDIKPEMRLVRNLRRTTWDFYCSDLAHSITGFPKKLGTEEALYLYVGTEGF